MRIGDANYNNYNNYIELFSEMKVNTNIKSTKVKECISLNKPYVDLPYTKAMSGNYAGNTIEDILTGHVKNSYGVEGMDITGRSDYKKIVKVPDRIKALVVNEVKREFYKYNGKCGDNMKELDSYNYYVNNYLKTLNVKDRLPASYTISEMNLDLSQTVSNAVKEKIPGWNPGKPIPSNILDDIFSDKDIVGSFADKNNLYVGIDEIV